LVGYTLNAAEALFGIFGQATVVVLIPVSEIVLEFYSSLGILPGVARHTTAVFLVIVSEIPQALVL
jgi:uncharacterized membrane protein